MLLHRGEDERIFKCLCNIVDIERKAGLYVITSGTRLGWFVALRNASRDECMSSSGISSMSLGE